VPEPTDLIRRLDAAINTSNLHPSYARGLLREAKEALENPRPHLPYAGRAAPSPCVFTFPDVDGDET
jgi:hypothetical protein